MGFVYVITNDVNGKQYVGKTNCSIEKRFNEHIYDSKRNLCENRPLYRAINKYGIEHFSIEQLEECNDEIINEREIYWIDKLNTYYNGYNATYGGDGRVLYDYNILVKSYQELGTITAVCKKFNCDKDTVRKACFANGITSVEIKRNSDLVQAKAVLMLDKSTNKILKEFESLTDAAIFLGDETKMAHIGKVCNGKRKTAYGYKWKYKNDN